MIEITNTQNNKIEVKTPYSALFVSRLKESIGKRKWDSEKRVWVIEEEDRDALMAVLKEVFGYEDDGGETCDVEITLDPHYCVDRGPIMIAGVVIAKAWGRDTGAKLGENVTVLKGGFKSGGSRVNWDTRMDEETVVRVKDFPAWGLGENVQANVKNFKIKKISDIKVNREKLMKEKEELLARLAEIDKILAE